ncbi:MAG: uroporphyrin-3 C-methyltransferase [Cryomorphaceae bacterium]|jgi:uroporphyrin-3 C-methyltransferase
MTESTQPSVPATTADTTSDTPLQNKSSDERGVKSGTGLSVFAVMLALVSLAGAGFTWYETQVSRVAANSNLAVGVTEIAGNVNRLGDAISRLQAMQSNVVSQEQLSTKLLQTGSAFNQQLDEVKQSQQGLTQAIERINQEMQKGTSDFVIDEVSQLLKLANTSALFSGDAASAMKALRLADSQLKELADPRFAVVRRKINQEVVLLDDVEQVDIESVSARLAGLANRIPSLPLENEPPVQGSVELLEINEGQQQTSWRTELGKMWRDILNSVQVQRVDQPPKPLLAPQQRYFLNQNLQLSLSKAELALLQGRSDVYVRSLDSASNWLSEYFDLENADVQKSLNELIELRALNISVELPAVAESYNLLQSIKGGL